MHAGYEAARPSQPPMRGPTGRAPLVETLRSTRAPFLIVEDQSQVMTVFVRALAAYSSEILTASTVAEAFVLALARQPHVMVLDQKLPDGWGLDLLDRLRSAGVLARVLIVSGYVTENVRERARTLGALAVLDKPVTVDDLVSAVHMAMAADAPLGTSWAAELEGSAAEQWVSLVVKGLQIPRDLKVREGLAMRGAMSLSKLKTICTEVKIRPHQTRDLARMLVALVWARRLDCALQALLNVGDTRMLERMIERAGLEGRTETATVREFLDRQQFVPQDNEAFRLLRHALLGEPEPRPH